MAKPGIKDPMVPRSTRAIRTLFSRPVSGLVGSAVVVRLATPQLEKLLSSAVGVRGPAGQVASLIGASAIGYGVGFGSMAALQKLRRQLISYLLNYKRWIFEQTSTKTKVYISHHHRHHHDRHRRHHHNYRCHHRQRHNHCHRHSIVIVIVIVVIVPLLLMSSSFQFWDDILYLLLLLLWFSHRLT